MTDAYTIEDMETIMRAEVDVYEVVRDPEETRRRHEHQDKQIHMLAEELLKGPIKGGCRGEIELHNMFGSDEWSALKRGILVRDPMCRMCGIRPTKEVHHIRPRFLQGRNHPRNLIGLCLECHDEVHRFIEDGIQKVLEDSLSIDPPRNEQRNGQTTLPIDKEDERWRKRTKRAGRTRIR